MPPPSFVHSFTLLDEPHVSTSQVLPFSAGFETGPGGPAYDDRQVFAFHHYCPTVDAGGSPSNEFYCDWFADRSIETRVVDSERLGGGSFLTEWGVFATDAPALNELATISALADKFLLSWAHWAYDTIGRLQLQNYLTNTYTRSTAGNPVSMEFDPATASFQYVYSASEATTNSETEIYLHESLWYPGGYTVTIHPPTAGRWTRARENIIVVTQAADVSDGSIVTVTIKRV